MLAATSLIPELEDVLQNGSRDKRVDALKRITSLFVDGAASFNEDHVQLFDDVFGHLIAEIETKARAELSQQLAPVENAPPAVVRKLAQDDDITVAGPLLSLSRTLNDQDLLAIATNKGQAHLLAIASRGDIDETVTDVLVKRGDREVISNVADNHHARLSETGFSTLVKRAEGDGELAEKVGQRPDIPPHLFRALADPGHGPCAKAPALESEAGNRRGNPPRAGESIERDRRQSRATRLQRSVACRRSDEADW